MLGTRNKNFGGGWQRRFSLALPLPLPLRLLPRLVAVATVHEVGTPQELRGEFVELAICLVQGCEEFGGIGWTLVWRRRLVIFWLGCGLHCTRHSGGLGATTILNAIVFNFRGSRDGMRI